MAESVETYLRDSGVFKSFSYSFSQAPKITLNVALKFFLSFNGAIVSENPFSIFFGQSSISARD